MLPLKPKDKRPLGRVVPNGLLDATTDIDIVGAWWSDTPEANIGLVTGIAFDALDLDGVEAIHGLNRVQVGYKHAGPVQQTGKGYHLLFAVTGASNRAKMGPNREPIDFRGKAGYICAAPSVHPAGHRYQWHQDGDLPEAPLWLSHMLFPPNPRKRFDARDPLISYAIERSDIVAEFAAAGYPATPHGNRYAMECPFPWHQDDTPSMVLYPDNNSFYCFGCMAWGDTINLRQFIASGDPTAVHA